MFLSQSTDLLDMLYYEMDASRFSSELFYYLLSLVIILMVALMIVLMVMIRSNSMMCHHLPCKIIKFEALKRQRGSEVETPEMLPARLF
jgi:hypothetical protein